jgi:hypothetical protein
LKNKTTDILEVEPPLQRRPQERYDVTLDFGAQGLEAARYVERIPERTTATDLLANSPR